MLTNTAEITVGPGNAPSAGYTPLGWVLSGRVGLAPKASYHLRDETEDKLYQLMKFHLSTEAFGVKPLVEKPRSREDKRAQYSGEYSYTSGRYVAVWTSSVAGRNTILKFQKNQS